MPGLQNTWKQLGERGRDAQNKEAGGSFKLSVDHRESAGVMEQQIVSKLNLRKITKRTRYTSSNSRNNIGFT